MKCYTNLSLASGNTDPLVPRPQMLGLTSVVGGDVSQLVQGPGLAATDGPLAVAVSAMLIPHEQLVLLTDQMAVEVSTKFARAADVIDSAVDKSLRRDRMEVGIGCDDLGPQHQWTTVAFPSEAGLVPENLRVAMPAIVPSTCEGNLTVWLTIWGVRRFVFDSFDVKIQFITPQIAGT